jgi:hypothetical protein
MADGGGGSAGPKPSIAGSQQHMRIEPEAVDAAYKLFDDAYNKVSAKVNAIYDATAGPWSYDPVSMETATKFNERTTGGGADSAMAALLGYQKQLENARDALKAAKETYQNQDESARAGLTA